MKVLIVKGEERPHLKNEIERTINLVLDHARVVKLNRSISLDPSVDTISEEEILTSGGFDLIIHHCGGSNPEYKKFIEAYKRLAHANGWGEPVIILFTGGVGIEETAKLYTKDPMICVASQRDLDANLAAFIKALISPAGRKGKPHRAPCRTLHRATRAGSKTPPSREWEQIAHDIAYSLDDYPAKRDEAREMLHRWERSMSRATLKKKIHLRLLKLLVDLDPVEVSRPQLFSALNRLKVSLGLDLGAQTETPNVDRFPGRPPKNYETVLIANDTPNLPLVQLLKADYNYRVLGQALNLKTAKYLLSSKRPRVVIADYMFRSKKEGIEFIREAKRAEWKPLVIANSYLPLSDDDLPHGVVNCSGDDAHNPGLINGAIWSAAGGLEQANIEAAAATDLTEDERLCRRNLETYFAGLEFHLELWRKFLYTDVGYTLRELHRRKSGRRTKSPGKRDAHYFVEELICVLKPFEKDRALSYQTVESLIEVVGILHRQMSGLPDSALVRNLRSLCHEIENRSTKNIRYLISRLRNTADNLVTLPRREEIANRIRVELDRCGGDFYLPHAERLCGVLRESLAALRPPSDNKDLRAEALPKKHFSILVAEDDDDWRGKFVIPVVNGVKEKLAASGYHIVCQPFDNKEDALRAAPPLNKFRKIAQQGDVDVSTIAVVDLNIPKDKGDAARVRASRKRPVARGNIIPQKRNGEELIKALRKQNVSVIVLSRSATRAERIKAERLGVANINYILKDSSKKGRLEAALLRNIERPRAHIIENLGKGEKHQFRIDGIEIPLTRKENRTFEAVCELGSGGESFTVQEILDLQRAGGREDTEQKYISSIRKKIQYTLMHKAGKVTGREEIIVTYQYDDGAMRTRYGLHPAVEYIPNVSQDDEGEVTRIMIVEDESDTQSYLHKRLARELRNVEIKCASSGEEAMTVARDFSPHIISLDLKLPRNSSSTNGDPNVGLDVLAEVKRFRNGVRAVVSTTQHGDTGLLDRAAELGLSNADFVPKLGENWEGKVVTRIERHQAELQSGRAAGIETDFVPPVVEILPGSDLKAGHLSLSIDGMHYASRVVKGTQGTQEQKVGPIIGLLLLKAGRTVTWEKIGNWVGEELSNDPRANRDDKKNWTKRCRNVIKKWLKDPNRTVNGVKITELILQRPKTGPGLKLDVRVVGP